MTADIRTAAQRESDKQYPETPFAPENEQLAEAFEAGAVWGANRVTPTRGSIARKLYETCWGDMVSWEDDSELFYDYADAILKLMAGLAEGESG